VLWLRRESAKKRVKDTIIRGVDGDVKDVLGCGLRCCANHLLVRLSRRASRKCSEDMRSSFWKTPRIVGRAGVLDMQRRWRV